MSDDLILAIDLGTTGCKVMVFDERGNALSRSYSEYPLFSSRPDFAEEDPRDWWFAVEKNMRGALSGANIPPGDIDAVGITGLAVGLLLLDGDGEPLRSAILTYMDSRAKAQRDEMISKVGKMSYPEMVVYSNLEWIRENEPRTFEKIEKVMDAREFIAYRLGAGISHDGRAITPERLEELNRIFNVPDELFGPPHFYDGPVGHVSDDIHKRVGLRTGIPIIVGPWDGMCNVIGSGLTDDGLAMDVAGATEIIAACTSRKLDILTHPHLIEGKWLVYTSEALGIAHRWFRDNLVGHGASIATPTLNPYELIDLMAAKAGGGATPIFIPTMKGEFMKPHMGGAIIGLSLDHDVNHIARALLEGVAYHIRSTIERIEDGGLEIKEVRVSGGGSRSRIWNQIKANVMGKTFRVMRVPETGCLGAAMLTAAAIEIYDDLIEATEGMVSISEEVEPEPEISKKYQKSYELYRRCYDAVDGVLHEKEKNKN